MLFRSGGAKRCSLSKASISSPFHVLRQLDLATLNPPFVSPSASYAIVPTCVSGRPGTVYCCGRVRDVLCGKMPASTQWVLGRHVAMCRGREVSDAAGGERGEGERWGRGVGGERKEGGVRGRVPRTGRRDICAKMEDGLGASHGA